jgi:3-hydroxyisobutyrate dehydrogenase
MTIKDATVRVGFIGLGSQGAPMAQRVIGAGYDTVVWARREATLAPFRNGAARIAGSPAELGKDIDLLETCVFDSAGTVEVIFGPEGAAHSMPPGAIIVCHSTVSPDEIAGIAAQAAEFGLRVLDAPVSGGQPMAEAGKLVTMVGGDERTYQEALPVLETFSGLVLRLGEIGAGQRAKLINNAALAAHLAVADAAFAIGAELALDRAALAAVLRAASGRSFGIDILAGAGSLAAVAQTQVTPTLSKDVRLLEQTLAGRPTGAAILDPAGALVRELDELAAHPGAPAAAGVHESMTSKNR